MRLQKMATYRLIRILRAVLPIIVLFLVGIPARNYWLGRSRNAVAEPKATSSAPDLLVHTVELTFDRSEGSRKVFHLTAKEQLSFKDNTHNLRDVKIIIWGEKPGEFDRTIVGDQCSFDQSTNSARFTGNVRAQLNETTSIHTEELIYTDPDRVISSPLKSHVEQPGEMMGDADRLNYSIALELLSLTGNVN